MALIKCPECGREISDQADTCIYCGYPLKKKQETTIVTEKKPLQSHVIGYRTGAGSVMAIYIVGEILAVILTTIFIAMGVLYGVWGLLAFILVLSVFLLAVCTFGLIRIAINSSNTRNCIEYDANDSKLVLCTLYGREIRIDPKDYVELRDNFMTDNMLMFTYRLPSGSLKKVNLGPCADRESLRSKIKNVIDNLDK